MKTDLPERHELSFVDDDLFEVNPITLQSRLKAEKRAMAFAVAKKVAVSIVALASLFWVLEGIARFIVVAAHPAQFSSREFDIKHALALQKPWNGAGTVYFLGSSYTSRAIYADLIERRLFERGKFANVRNLASMGSFPMDNLHLLKTAVENGNKPTAVICEFVPVALKASKRFSHDYSDAFKGSYAGRIISHKPGSSVRKELLFALEKHSYLVHYRAFIRELLTKLPQILFDSDNGLRPQFDHKVRELSSVGGWVPDHTPGPFGDPKLSAQGRIGYLKKMTFFDEQKQQELDYRIIDSVGNYCREQKIPLVILWLPTSPEFRRLSAESLNITDAQLVAKLRSFDDGKDTLVWDMNKVDDKSLFVDADHLNVRGAIQISEKLVDKVETLLPVKSAQENRSN
ncbi:MAG: hypothetical protein IAF58_12430 [Leptolyngbya sp.]|nr:hypothetical protein [Candidatus Melainabacteria bacterium]